MNRPGGSLIAVAAWMAVALTPEFAPAAGPLDKLNEATTKMEQSSEGIQRPSQPQSAAGLRAGGGSLSGSLGATSTQGWEDFRGCMTQTVGSHEKLTAQVLQRKLNRSKDLSPQQRRAIEHDIAWLNAKAAGSREPAPDPKNPQRYLLELTDEEQREISSATNRFNVEVRDKCDAQYGGMSQFADPTGRRKPSIDTRVPLPDLLNATPPASASRPAPAPGKPPSVVAHELGTACMAQTQKIRWELMADRMERRLQSQSNLSPPERRAWEEDIAAVRATAASGNVSASPQSPDPKNPARYVSRLTAEDHVAMSQEYAARSREIMANCAAPIRAERDRRDAESIQRQAEREQRQAERDRGRGEELAARATAEAEANVAAQAKRAERAASGAPAAGGGGSLSAGLGATRADHLARGGVGNCFDRTKGHMAKVTADTLEAKLQTASDLSPQKRKEWEEDIAAWRHAERNSVDTAVPPDLSRPYRWETYLTKDERAQINQKHSTFVNQIVRECNSIDHMGTGRPSSR